MIDFNNIKFAAFDFDDTLCVHQRHTRWSDLQFDIDVLKFRSGEGKSPWYNSRPNKSLNKFINVLADRDVLLGLISAEHNGMAQNYKVEWVKENYDNGHLLHNFCVGRGSDKVIMLQSIKSYYELEASKILLVDDSTSLLNDASSEGFQVATPIEIATFVENDFKW